VQVTSTTTLKAFASGAGFTRSGTSVGKYTIIPFSPTQAISAIVGPVIAFGSSPWPWYDQAAKGNADDISSVALAHKPVLGSMAAGTFTLADGCNITLTGPGASEFGAGDFAIVGWNSIEGSGMGHLLFSVQSRIGVFSQAPTSAALEAYRQAPVFLSTIAM
jgi:hypothetical protein